MSANWAARNVGVARVGIAVMILFLYGMAMATMGFTAIPAENKDVFIVLVGGLNTALGGIVGYFFNITNRKTEITNT